MATVIKVGNKRQVLRSKQAIASVKRMRLGKKILKERAKKYR